MNFNWLISLTTALFASVIGVPSSTLEKPKVAVESRDSVMSHEELVDDRTSPAIEKNLKISREISVEKSVDNSKIATEADLVDFLGGIYQGKFVPREDLLAMSKVNLTKEIFAEKLLELVESKLPENFTYPPIKEAIRFRDISRENPIFDTAQKLKSLEILPENNGFFGQLNEQNPVVKISEMKQVINKAFDEKGNLNFFQDKDADGVPNSLDACPDISAKNGCPEQKEVDKFPNNTVLEVSDIVNVVEQKEIQIGDKFSAIIFDPETGEIFTKSEPVIVTK